MDNTPSSKFIPNQSAHLQKIFHLLSKMDGDSLLIDRPPRKRIVYRRNFILNAADMIVQRYIYSGNNRNELRRYKMIKSN